MNVIALYQNNDTNELHHRRLQVEDGGVSSNTGDSRARYIQKVYITKTLKSKSIHYMKFSSFTTTLLTQTLDSMNFSCCYPIHTSYKRNLLPNLTA